MPALRCQLEVVWSTAEQFAQRCLRDYEEAENRHRLLYPPASDGSSAEAPPAARSTLELKAKKYEQARKLASNAKKTFEQLAISTGKLSAPNDLDD